MMGSVEERVEGKDEKKGGREEGLILGHEAPGDAETNPAEGDPEQKHAEIDDPQTRSEEFEEREVINVGTGGRELKEIPVNPFAMQHAQGVLPEKGLVPVQIDGGIGENEEVQVEVEERDEEQPILRRA